MRADTVDPNYIGLDGTDIPIQKNSGLQLEQIERHIIPLGPLGTYWAALSFREMKGSSH
jgi:hypothetical protein